MKKYLLILLAFLVLPFGVSATTAAYNDTQITEATTLFISGIPATLIASVDSNVASITVNDGNIVITGVYTDASHYSNIILTSNQKLTLTNNWGLQTACAASSSSLSINWTSTSSSSITITPTTATCTSGSGSDIGGGGGGSYIPPTPPATPTCNPACVHGTCSATNTCTCSGGYTGTTCSVAPTTTIPATPTIPVSQMTQDQLLTEVTRISALIAQLQTQLLQLQGQEGAFTTDLYYGMRGNSDVTRLQQFLIDKGYLTGSATGNYLTKTVAAVKAYQTAKGITPVNGRFGPKTRAAVNADLGY